MVGGCLFCLCTGALLAYYSPKAKTHKKYLLPSRPPPSFKCWLKLLRFSTSNRPYCWQNGCSVELSVCTLLSSTLWTVGKLVVFAIVVYSSVWVGNRVYYFLLLFCVYYYDWRRRDVLGFTKNARAGSAHQRTLTTRRPAENIIFVYKKSSSMHCIWNIEKNHQAVLLHIAITEGGWIENGDTLDCRIRNTEYEA